MENTSGPSRTAWLTPTCRHTRDRIRHTTDVLRGKDWMFLDDRGRWIIESLSAIKTYIKGFGHDDYAVAEIIQHHLHQNWLLTRIPFDKEYQSGRVWNRDGARYKYSPTAQRRLVPLQNDRGSLRRGPDAATSWKTNGARPIRSRPAASISCCGLRCCSGIRDCGCPTCSSGLRRGTRGSRHSIECCCGCSPIRMAGQSCAKNC